MNTEKWMKENCTSLEGKTICITGSTGGLAQKFTEKLASLGANFIFANRDKQKSEKQKEFLLNKYPNIKIEIIIADMFNMDTVKLLVCKLKQKHIDILILNSAVYNIPRKTSTSGYDNVFQINFISPYYITKHLMTTLRKVKNSKVIIIGSIAHKYSKINLDDPQLLKNAKQSKIYGNSKRFIMFSLEKLFSNSPVKFSITHPGITLTQMTNHYPWFINPFVKLGIKLFFPKPEKACLSILYSIFNDTGNNEWIGPRKHNIWGYPKIKKLKTCSEQEKEEIFNIAENIFNKI